MTLPTSIVIGAPEGGSTSLYHYLRQHSQVAMGALKDGHFFFHDGEPPPVNGPSDRPRRRETAKRFEEYRRLFAAAGDTTAIGEVGVRYLDSPAACRRIQARLARVRLVAILRHPVNRAYSHFLMYRRNGSEPCPSFAAALADEPRRLGDGWFCGLHRSLRARRSPVPR